MDRHDEEFETFLRQFRLRSSNRPVEAIPVGRRVTKRWMLVAAAILLAVPLFAAFVQYRVRRAQVDVQQDLVSKPVSKPPATGEEVASQIAPIQTAPIRTVPIVTTPVAPPPVAVPPPNEPDVRGPIQAPQPPLGRGPKKRPRLAADDPRTDIFERVCSTCHNYFPLNLPTRESYAAYVRGKMAKGAMVSEDEFPLLVDYLFDRGRLK